MPVKAGERSWDQMDIIFLSFYPSILFSLFKLRGLNFQMKRQMFVFILKKNWTGFLRAQDKMVSLGKNKDLSGHTKEPQKGEGSQLKDTTLDAYTHNTHTHAEAVLMVEESLVSLLERKETLSQVTRP